jgi:hypothetical protein
MPGIYIKLIGVDNGELLLNSAQSPAMLAIMQALFLDVAGRQ